MYCFTSPNRPSLQVIRADGNWQFPDVSFEDDNGMNPHFGRSRCVRQHFPGGLPLPSPLFRPIPAAVCQGLLRPDIHLLLVGTTGGTRHTIAQGEGCEQGDALAPALFALGQHAGLLAAATQLQPGETLAAYLDDLYILTSPARARTCLDAVSRAVHAHSGIAANPGQDPGLPPGRWPPTTRHQRPWPGCLAWRRAAARRVQLPCLGHPYRHACLCPSGLGRPRASPSRLPPRAPAPAWLASCLAPAHILRRAPGPASCSILCPLLCLPRLRRRTTRPSGRRWPGCFKSRPPRPYLFPPGPWLSYQPDWAA